VLKNKNYFKNICFSSCSIGIKNILDTVELAKQATDNYRVAKFLAALEEIAGLHDIND
jgi:hypothetical protein